MILKFLALVLMGSLSGCLGVSHRGGIMSYRDGVVWTGTKSFAVPRLPPPWKSAKIQWNQLVHENDPLQATIVTDILCGEKFDDAPLKNLGHEMFRRLQGVKTDREEHFVLRGRDAFRLSGHGAIDGVPIQMESVAMKKDFCLYDYTYFAPPASFSKGWKDFERYLHEFR